MTTSSTSVMAARFEQHAQEVYAWAYRLLGRHHDALDVVQDVFLRWSKQCEREVPSVPRGWLRRVTVNRAVDVVRGRRSECGSLDDVTEVGAGDPVDRAIDEEALRGDVAAALNRLTDIQRGVLIAKVYDEMTFSQISAEYGISLSTAKTHYLRAVKGVRDRLRGWEGRASEENAR